MEDEEAPAALPAAVGDCSPRVLLPSIGGGEGGEIVLAQDCRSCRFHGPSIQFPLPLPNEGKERRGNHGAQIKMVPVGLSRTRVAGVKIG